MEIVIIFLRFIKQTRPTSILHSFFLFFVFFFILRIPFFILRISFYSSFSFFILCILFL